MAKYSGWANYETWNLALWISNDQGLSTYFQELAGQVRDEPVEFIYEGQDDLRTKQCKLGQLMKEYMEEIVDEIMTNVSPCFVTDLLGAAMSEVDWREIAEHYEELEEVPE